VGFRSSKRATDRRRFELATSVVVDLPDQKRHMMERLHLSNDVLQHRKVLVVDDDVGNIFALATVLESQGMEVISATNGRQTIELIERTLDLI
jgi:PleD family two-component response regulator